MKKFIIFCALSATFTSSYSQDLNFKNDTSFVPSDLFYARLKKPTDYEFQLRLYFENGIGNKIKIGRANLMLIILRKGIWSAEKYLFTWDATEEFISVKIDSAVVKIDDYNKLFTELKNDSLFTLKTLTEDQIVQMAYKRTPQNKLKPQWYDGVPPPYYVEVLAPNAARGFEIRMPKSYFDSYHLPELENYVLVLKKLLGVMGMSGPY